MLSLLLEAALRSLLLGAIVWFSLKILRIRDPRVHMTAWIVVLLASLTMPAMMRWMVVTLPTAAPPLRIVEMIEVSAGIAVAANRGSGRGECDVDCAAGRRGTA